VSFASPWALAGLLLAIPLLLLHLRRPRPRTREVGSLLAWRRTPAAVGLASRRLGRPASSWLLALQLLALLLFVLALARPHTDGGHEGSIRAFVVDDSIWMGAREGGQTRLEAAESTLREELEALPGDQRVAVFLAGPETKLLYEGGAAGALEAAARIPPTFGPADLAAALRQAAAVPGRSGAIELLRAPEDAAPRATGPAGVLRERVVGAAIADQGIADASGRCLPGSRHCQLFARVENTAKAPRVDRVEVLAAGRRISEQTVHVPAGGSAPIAFEAPAGARLTLALVGGDPLAADDRAYVAVPAVEPVRVTLVGEKKDAEPLARALLAVPGARVTLRTPADFRPADARRAGLVVIDGREPRRPVPAGAAAVIRVDPTRLPGGSVDGPLARNRLSGADEASPALEGVDLDSLTIGRGGARRLTLPPWLRAVAWAPGGPLLALGTHAGRREAALALDPADSNLPQLASFPRLIANLVDWSQEWAPATASAGLPFLALRPQGAGPTEVTTAAGGTSHSTRAALKLPRPGFYALRQHGPWGTRARTIAANPDLTAPPAGAPVALTPVAAPMNAGTDLWPWLLAAALVVLLAELALAIHLGQRGRAFLALRAAALLLLVVALLRPRFGDEAPPTTVLIQRSPGVTRDGAAAERRWDEAAASCSPRCRVLEFGGGDLEVAAREAIATTPHGGRVVVLADGRQARGDAGAASATARSRGVEVDAAPLPEGGRDAAVTRIEVPPAARAGDPLPIALNVRSTVAAPATVSLTVDGKPRGSRRVRLAPGDNPYLLSLTAGAAGSHSYRATVRMAGDELPANDALAATQRVGARPRALIVSAGASRLPALLRADGIAVTTTAPAGLPTDPAALGRFQVVALDDVAAPQLGTARARALASAVRAGRTGLFVAGGPHGFSLGGYYASPLQAALPVTSLKPGNLQRRNLGLEMVLDRSGSMAEAVAGVPKISMVRVAAKSATGFIAKHHDQFGAIAFDVAPHTVVPLTRLDSAADAAAVNRAIDRIRAEGGTNIYKALAAGAAEIEKSDERNRHIVLLSDGISEKGSYAALVPRLKAEHITVSTVALGLEADFELLDSIAKATGGHFYATADPRELPQIFTKDTRAAARPVRLHGTIGVTAGEDSPIVRDLAGTTLPALHGNVVTELKPGAEAVLLGADKDHPPDPTLAQWQYGAGRVVTWTPGLGEEWASAWAKLPRLWADVARWVEPAPPAAPLTPRIAPGTEGEVEVDEAEGAHPLAATTPIEGSILTPGGRPTMLDLSAAAPWRWSAALPDRRPGVDAYAVRAAGHTSRGLLAVPYAASLRPLPTEATPLGGLASNSGGRLLAATDTGLLGGSRTDPWWWFAIASLACFIADICVRLFERRYKY
jgi:Ca-activated chloride channel homolog